MYLTEIYIHKQLKRYLLFLFSNISELTLFFRQTNRKFKTAQYMKHKKYSVIKLVKEQKKSQLKYYQMALYTRKKKYCL